MNEMKRKTKFYKTKQKEKTVFKEKNSKNLHDEWLAWKLCSASVDIRELQNGIGRNANGFGRTLPDCLFHEILQKSHMDPKI
ncbi:hypothetical protein T4A_2784 [Trichinella pseudospiralis]|uniref:Uncharacterized protein n=1 Tax=Trichinella pseudospiralis TaxID=6337 RepID=A0A0V1EHR4_TRIPS|nr:hypothetical protein T4A_2784 [Trichinella pseudospiralis]